MDDLARQIFAVRRPAPALMKYYALTSVLLGPLFFIALIPLYFRYHTLRYELDEEGISMQWGILFHRQITLTYARIQDIHLTSNFVERWLGLARIQIQTASGSADAEMTLEGLHQFEMIRDFLYSRMRGAHQQPRQEPNATEAPNLAAALHEVATELRATRVAIEKLTEGSKQ